MRVAAVQFEVTDDVDANLVTCQRMIGMSREECDPDLIVLPEYCNHPPLYGDPEHCFEVAQPPEGMFLATIAREARKSACMIQVNVTTRHRNNAVRNTNTMFSSDGRKIGESNKQFLITGENFFLEKPDHPSDIIETQFGNVGMYSCMDGVSMEVTRSLALRGAQLLSNSLCSFAPDEDWLHLPVRAAENKVFVIAANKVGRLVPDGLVESIVGDRNPKDVRELMGGGASQIVAPDGTVLARAPVDHEAVVWADIDLEDATKKGRPDSSDIFADRRPELYQPIASMPQERARTAGADCLNAAVWCGSDTETAIDDAIEAVLLALEADVQILALPELAFLPAGKVVDVSRDSESCARGIDRVAGALAETGSLSLVATSVVGSEGRDAFHQGVVIGKDGIVLRQNTLHRCGRHPWVTAYGDELATLDTDMARFAIVAGGDASIPETFRLLAIMDVAVVAVPTKILEPWEARTGFLERAAENRQSLVVATRPTDAGTGMIVTLEKDFTQGTTRADGQQRARTLSWPITARADRDTSLMRCTIYPSASSNRLCSVATDLVAGRPWNLAGAIAEQVASS